MEELELLKKDWKNESRLPNFSEEEIFKMTKRKSISVAKLLVIFGVIEAVFWIFLEYFDSEFSFKNITGFMIVRIVQFILFIVLIIYFYFKINAVENSKKLMSNILNLRKIILFYIILIFLGAIFYFITNYDDLARSVVAGYTDGYNGNAFDTTQIEKVKLPFQEKIVIVGFLMLFAFPFLIFVYKITYGELLKKLNENYHELQKTENNN